MKRSSVTAAFALALAVPAFSQQTAGPAAVKLSLASPSLGQPAPGFFSSLGAQLWSSARQAAGSWVPTMSFLPSPGAPAPVPPALPPSLVPGEGAVVSPQVEASALPAQGPAGLRPSAGDGRLPSLDSPALGGVIPLRPGQAEPLSPLHRRTLSLSAKAEALRAPLQRLADLRVAQSDAGAERASRAGRQISDIVSDEWASGSAGSAASLPGPAAGQAMGEAELASLRDAVAEPPAGSFGAASAAGSIAPPQAVVAGQAKPAGAAAAAFSEAMDAAATYGGQSLAPHRAAERRRWESREPAPAPGLDPELLVLRVFDQLLNICRAAEASAAAELSDLLGGSDVMGPASAGRLIGPPAPPPTYALGARGPVAGPEAMGLGGPAAAGAARADRSQAAAKSPFDVPESLPRSIPPGLLASLLLPLIGIVLFYLREFRR